MRVTGTTPRVFVGSSKEGLELAKAVATYLAPDFDAVVWNHGLFRPGLYTMEVLDSAVREFDFAVIVGTPDDELTRRSHSDPTIRDNLVFELGMFSAVLGRRKALLLVPEGVDIALPSDLNGLGLAMYLGRSEPAISKETLDALQGAVTEIRKAFLAEVLEQQKADRIRLAALIRGQKLGAVSRLFKAVVQLRDLCIELPTQVLGSLGDFGEFEAAKSEAAAKVATLHDGWRRDATLLGVHAELEALALATQRTIRAFPYPAVMVTDVDAVSVGRKALEGSLQAYERGAGLGDSATVGFGHVVGEFEARVQDLAERYSAWWQGQAVELRRLAYVLSDRLAEAALSLGFENSEP